MCPEQKLLSVYFDGELPSPWKEKMDSHLAECSKCADTLESFRFYSESFTEKTETTQRMEEAKERVLLNLSPRFERKRPIFWRRTVSLPLPALAAAVAVFVFAFVFVIAGKTQQHNADALPSIAAVENVLEFDVSNIRPASMDMNSVLNYLGRENSADYMIIRLPDYQNFTTSGEPLLVKDMDYLSIPTSTKEQIR